MYIHIIAALLPLRGRGYGAGRGELDDAAGRHRVHEGGRSHRRGASTRGSPDTRGDGPVPHHTRQTRCATAQRGARPAAVQFAYVHIHISGYVERV